MRRTIVLLCSLALAVVVASGVALAATTIPIQCDGGLFCEGTRKADTINGSTFDDFITADRGADTLFGDEGIDVLLGEEGNDTIDARDNTLPATLLHPRENVDGGAGNDTIYADDGIRDEIKCGSGKRDVVTYDYKDFFWDASDCENAIRNTAYDPG